MDFTRKICALWAAGLLVAGCNKAGAPPVEPRPLPVAEAQHAAPLSEAAAGQPLAEVGNVAPASHVVEAPHLETSWITDDYFAALIFHPRQMLHHQPLAGESRAWLDAAAADLGFTLDDLDQVCFLVGPPDLAEPKSAAPFATGWVFRFATPAGQQGMLKRFLGEAHSKQTTYQGHVYYKDERAPVVLCAPDKTTVLLVPERSVKKALGGATPRSELLLRLGAVQDRPDVVGAVDAKPLRPLLRRFTLSDEAKNPAYAWAHQLSDAVHHLDEATLTVDLADETLARLTMDAEDSESAQRLEEMAQGYRGAAALVLSALRGQWVRGEDGKGYAPLFALGRETLAGITTSRQVRQVVVEAPAPAALADLPQTLEAALVAATRGAARQERVRRLQMIGLALHNYHVVKGSFPLAASRDVAGRPLLSWRVHLLPWLGETELYQKFRLDQPWDSPHNRALIAHMPAVFHTPGAAQDGRTRMVAPMAPGTPLAASRPVALNDFTDGPDQTILLVECGPDRSVPWTQPEDMPVDLNDPLAALGSVDKEGFLSLYGDGRVEIIRPVIAAHALKALFTHAGGEPTTSSP